MTNPWIARGKPQPPGAMQLFCFPHAGAGASAFRAWQPALAPAIEVRAVQLPGRESRFSHPAITDLRHLVDALASALTPEFSRPFAFFGHSYGSWVAFELARQLEREGRPGPAHLFVSGRRAPRLPQRVRVLHALPEKEFIAELSSLYGGMQPEIFEHAELRELLLPVIRADLTAAENYRYTAGPPLACPISAFGGREDPSTTDDELSAWSEETSGSSSVDWFPGGHFFVETQRAPLLEVIRARITTDRL